MKYLNHIVLTLALILGTSLFSQNNKKIDSLKLLISKAADDSNKVMLFYQLSRHYDVYKTKEHIEYSLSALNLAKKIKYVNGIKKHYANVIRFLFQKGVYDLAIAYYHDYQKFLIENKFTDDLLTSYNMYGNLLSRQKKYTEALNYYHQAKAFHLSKNNFPSYANVLNNLSILFVEIKEYDSALVYGSAALGIYKKTNASAALANSILGIAEIQLKKGDFKNAESGALQSFDIYKSINEKQGMCNCYYVLGQIHLNTGNYEDALSNTNKSLKLATELNFLEIKRDCFFALSNIFHLMGNNNEAYKSHVLFKNISDSIAAEILQGKMLEMEVKYDISNKENKLKEKEFEIDSKNKQRNYLALIVLIILILFFISIRAYFQKKKANKVISEQKKLVDEKQKEVLESINYAKRIQFTLLANDKLLKQNLPEHFVLFKPKDIVSGDFYWATQKDNRFYLAVCDSTGHGVPGAFMSLLNISFLNEAITEKNIKEPNEILNHVRNRLILNISQQGGQDGMDAILMCIETDVDTKLKTITYSAGNNAPILIKNNSILELPKDKMPIGKGERTNSFTLHSIDCKKGDTIYLYTDGFADQFGGAKGKKFKYKALNELLLSVSKESSNKQSEILNENFNIWKGNLDQVDDVCILGINI